MIEPKEPVPPRKGFASVFAGAVPLRRGRPLASRLGSLVVSIVVPTYNERGNLEPLLEGIDEALGRSGVPYEVVVVDDDSPDGTWKRARELADRYPVRAVRRTDERGLASAVLLGVAEAKDDVVVVMDADLQHPPGRIPDLLEAIDGGADIAIASRFVEGGSAGGLSRLRRFVSAGADFLARTIFRRARPVSDIQSGFFAFRRQVTEGADLDPVGYKILLEILVLGDYDSVEEVPYTFREREEGKSKLGMGSILDYARHVVSLAWRAGEVRRFGQFATVGASGALLNLLSLHVLLGVGVHYLLAGAVGIEVGLLSNFGLNAVWTFRDRGPESPSALLRSLGRDHVVRSVGMTSNLVVLWLLTGFVGIRPLVSQAVGIGVATAWNYTGNQWWTWGP